MYVAECVAEGVVGLCPAGSHSQSVWKEPQMSPVMRRGSWGVHAPTLVHHYGKGSSKNSLPGAFGYLKHTLRTLEKPGITKILGQREAGS